MTSMLLLAVLVVLVTLIVVMAVILEQPKSSAAVRREPAPRNRPRCSRLSLVRHRGRTTPTVKR